VCTIFLRRFLPLGHDTRLWRAYAVWLTGKWSYSRASIAAPAQRRLRRTQLVALWTHRHGCASWGPHQQHTPSQSKRVPASKPDKLDYGFSWHCLLWQQYSGLWHGVVWCTGNNITEEPASCIERVWVWPENWRSTVIQNFVNCRLP
jgi:hypothetical protein